MRSTSRFNRYPKQVQSANNFLLESSGNFEEYTRYPQYTSFSQNNYSNFSSFDLTTSEQTTPPCAEEFSCRQEDLTISTVILLFSIVAFLENTALAFATHKWQLGKTCKMFAFLWHLSVVDAMVALTFSYFHIRILTSCPVSFSCTEHFQVESLLLVVFFFSTIGASHLFMLAATTDRFIAIKWSLHYTKLVTTKNMRVTTLCIWFFSFLFPVLGALGILFWDNFLAYSIVTVVCSSTCLLAAACSICLNVWLIRFAWTTLRGARTSYDYNNRPSNEQSSASSLPEWSVFQENGKLIVTLALFVGSFVISCAPWSVALIACDWPQSCTARKDKDYTLVLVLLHALVIPVLYGFRVDEVKNRVIRFWKSVLIRIGLLSY